MNKKFLTIAVFVMFIIVGIVGYFAFDASANSAPDDVSEEFWGKSTQITIYLNKITNDNEQIPEGLVKSLEPIIVTEKENEIYRDLLQLTIKSSLYGISKILGQEESEAKNEYNKMYGKLENLFGERNLKESKLDMELIEEIIATGELNAINETLEAEENFKKEAGVSLTGKEVQFDLANNLDKKFYLAGEVELCDYYNYGYTNESAYFCGKLMPSDGGYSDSWYLYFHRDSFKGVYESLLDGNVNLRVVAEIPSKIYKRGQDRMAVVNRSEGY